MAPITDTAISVIGLGKLGAPLAALLANRGHRVIGVDVNETAVALVGRGQTPVDENGLQDLIGATAGRLTATTSLRDAVVSTDVTFVVVPTPSTLDGGFDLRFMLDAITKIGQALREKPGVDHVVVVTSTVLPGSTEGPIREALELGSGRALGDHLGLCYSPEFIALGSVIRDMRNPDLLLLGQSDAMAGDVLEAILTHMVDTDPPVMRMNLVDAELAKISINTFVTAKISFANMVAEICERLPGADVDVVMRTVGLDSRIGGKYLRGATAFGGPCFPRDNAAFGQVARLLGTSADLAEATDRINRRQAERLLRTVFDHLPEGGRVGILGLTYKPGTAVIDKSPGLDLAALLIDKGHRPVVFDPQASDAARRVLGDTVDYAPSAEDCLGLAAVAVVTTAWPEFEGLQVPVDGSAKTVIDCWRVLSQEGQDPSVSIVYPGKGN